MKSDTIRALLKKVESTKTDHSESRILLIDGTNTFLRIWSSVPFMAANGEHAGGIVGFLRSIGSNIRDFNPSRCVIVFDGKGGSHRRRKIFSEYKQHRSGKYNIRREEFDTIEDERESQRRQMVRTIQYLAQLPIQVLCIDDVEADDVISYLAMRFLESSDDSKIRIVSTDRDFLQLVGDRLEVYSPVKKKLYTPSAIENEFGFNHKNYLLYRILSGDVADNIDGVRGIGLKTFIKEFPEVVDSGFDIHEFIQLVELTKYYTDNRKRFGDRNRVKRVHQLILDNVATIERNHKLMQLSNVDISGITKLKILETIEQPTPLLNSVVFKEMILYDYLMEAFKYPDSWLQDTFYYLNRFAQQGQ